MIGTVRTKDGVQFERIAPAGFAILAAIHAAALAENLELTITNGTEGHAVKDPHTTGEAYDLRVNTIPAEVLPRLALRLMSTLGPAFQVLYEVRRREDAPGDHGLDPIIYINAYASAPHLHIQRRKGTTYPPKAPAAPATVKA